MLDKFIRSTYLNLFSGLALLVTSGYEIWSTIDKFSLGAHHGIFIFSAIQILKALPEIMHGVKEIEEAKS